MQDDTISPGLCKCGCGRATRNAPKTMRSRGWVKGQPLTYITGHNRRLPRTYVAEDRGYATPCWIWQGATTGEGYATYSVNGVHHKPYRELYEAKHGKIPGGLVPDHLCRVRDCVNPDHVEPVTVTENVRRGSTARLTMADAERIRREVSAGPRGTQAQLAREYGINPRAVNQVVKGINWRP